MSSRDQILGRIRTNLSGHPLRQDAAAADARLAAHRPNLVPARAQVDAAGQLALFEAKCAALNVRLTHVPAMHSVPAAIATCLQQHNLPNRIRMSSAAELTDLPWDTAPMLEPVGGAAEITDAVSVTPALAAIAETGTLMLASGPETPATLNFVPDDHIVVLRRSRLRGTLEEAFADLRAVYGDGNMPRTVNLISGPSRTGDVEQKIVMGAHGPRRLHILLVEDSDTDAKDPA